MPTFEVTGPDGKKYRVDAPKGATLDQAIAYIADTHYVNGQKKGVVEDYLEEVPLVGDLLVGAGDVVLGAGQGLAGIGKATADAFGADNSVSDFFEEVSKDARELMSAQERGDLAAGERIMKEAEGKGIWEEVKAAVSAFSKSPLTLTAQAIGSAAPFVAATVATGGGAAAGIGLGALTGAGTVKGTIYDSVVQEAVDAGMDPKQAATLADEAQSYLGDNTDQIALGTVLGGVAARFGMEPALAKVFGQQVAKRAILRGAAEEAIPEMAQAGQERFAGNLAADRAGFDTPLGKGVAGQAALEGIMGGVSGAGIGAISRGTPEPTAEAPEELPPDLQVIYDAIPANADEATLNEYADVLVERYRDQRGFPEDVAKDTVRLMAAQKAAEENRRKQEAAQRAANLEARTAGIEPGVEPDITAPGMERIEDELTPPPVDPEEAAAQEQFYQSAAPEPSIIPPLESVTPQAKFNEQLGGTDKKLENDLKIYRNMVARGQLPPTPLVNSIAAKLVDASATGGLDALTAGPLSPIVQQFYANEASTINELAVQKAPANPEVAPAAPPQPMPMTPERAGLILNDPVALSEFEASGGDVDALYAAAEGEDTGIRYSRGRPPKTTADDGLFGALPLQEAPSEDTQRDEFNAFRFAPEEEKAQLQEAATDVTDNIEKLRQRETEQREETLGDIEYALRAQAPENAVYKVVYNPEDASPYQLVAETQLGKKPETVLRAKTLQDFSNSVYGQMMELTPYTPETPTAMQEIDPIQSGELEAPTVATQMVQEFTAEVDAAREAGQIDNLQRAELLQRLQRPNAYRTLPNGRTAPNDVIAKLEAAAEEAASALRNAPAAEWQAAKTAFDAANERLATAVQNSLLNPARAKLKSMVEMRQDERLGAKVRIKEAKETGDTQELRDAQIDLKETKAPNKYRRGPDKNIISGSRASDVQVVVDKVTSQWKADVGVEVVQSVEDISDPKVRRALKRDDAETAEGFVTKDGTVYLIADNISSPERARAVLFHEALGHLGLEAEFRGALDTLLVSLYRGNAAIRAATDTWRVENKGAYDTDANPLARAVEEVLAERSETGQLKPSMIRRIASFIRDFLRRHVGIYMPLSDLDVEHILARAHERIVSGDKQGLVAKGMRYITGGAPGATGASKPKTTKKTAAALEDVETAMSAGLRRATKTQNTYAMAEGIGDAIRARKMGPFVDGLRENAGPMSPTVLRNLLKAMPTSGIIDWFGKEIPSLADIDDLVQRMSNMRANIIKAAEPTAIALDKFLLRDKDQQLASTQHTSRINEISPDEHKSMVDALQNHKVMQELEKRVLANANDKKLARQLLDELKKAVAERKTKTVSTIQRKLERDAIDMTQTDKHVKQVTELTRRIRDTFEEWDKLGKIEGGQKLYKEMRAFYKDMFEAEMALLDARVEAIADKEQSKRLRDMRAEMMREALDPEEAKKAGDIFWDVDGSLFTKDYFPFMREGKYWLRVKGTKTREPEFYAFHSAFERNNALKAAAKRLGADKDDNKVFAIGDEIEDLQEDLRSEDMLMQKIFSIADKTRRDLVTGKNVNINEMIDDIYQTWLLTTPERSVRRRLMHSQEITGFSQEILSHFSRQVTGYANQLSKLAFAGQIRMQVEAAKDSIKDRPVTQQPKLQTAIREIETRTEQEINPAPQNWLVNGLNRLSYFYFLTAPATALIQTTSIPIRVVPRLWREYGYAKGTAMWVKYMKLWNTLGTARVETIKTGWGDEWHAKMPSVTGSKLINNDTPRGKLLQRALKAGMERNVLETVTDTLVQNERETTKQHREGLRRTVAEQSAQVASAMSVLFQGMENISRQASYFMTFELAYDDYKAKKPNAPEQEVFDHAVRKGLEVVRDALGEYTSWERPSLAKGNWTRALFLFKMHAIVQTKFLIQNFRALWKGSVRGSKSWLGKGQMTADQKAEYVGAIKELSGVLMMAGMFGGLMGLPLYSIMAWALAEGFDDEDDEDVRKLMGLDPRVAYDSDIMFRKWLMEKFGPPEVEVFNKDGTLRDDRPLSLADMLIHGPIAAFTDTDLASRTSMDIKNMWFREGMGGDNTATSAWNLATANVAGLSMAVSMGRGWDDFQNGDIAAGIKKVLPAFFRSPFTMFEQDINGVYDKKGNTIIPKEDIDAFDNARSLLGFRPMGLARWQDYYITRAKNDKKIKSEREKILRNIDRQVQEGDIKSMDDFRKVWAEEVVPFNRTYPDPNFVIETSDILKSLKSREKNRADTFRGMQLKKQTAQRDLEMAKAFAP